MFIQYIFTEYPGCRHFRSCWRLNLMFLSWYQLSSWTCDSHRQPILVCSWQVLIILYWQPDAFYFMCKVSSNLKRLTKNSSFSNSLVLWDWLTSLGSHLLFSAIGWCRVETAVWYMQHALPCHLSSKYFSPEGFSFNLSYNPSTDFQISLIKFLLL